MSDGYIIIISAFAVYGLCSAVLLLFSAADELSSPPSVTFMAYSRDDKTHRKEYILHNDIPNNTVLFVTEDENVTNGNMCRICEISAVVRRRLFTKKDD